MDPEFTPYSCSLGTVTGIDGDVYIINTVDGRVIGVRANDEATEANVENDILSPAPDPQPTPTPVSPKQIRFALNAAGLRTQVEDAIAMASQSTKDAWEYATTIERNDPLLTAMAAALSLTDDEVDALFTAANSY